MIQIHNNTTHRHDIYGITLAIFLLICFLGVIPTAAMQHSDERYFPEARPLTGSSCFNVVVRIPMLPARIPEVDRCPLFESVHLLNPGDRSGKICFSGSATDDVMLKNIRIVVKTPAGSRVELINRPISGQRIDLSKFCIDGIYDLQTASKGDYEVDLAVTDSADQAVSKTFYVPKPSLPECRQDMYGGQCVNFVRDFFGGRYDLMPGLCMYEDCGAYHAWDAWDLGYGKGHLPEKKSILILDKGRLLYGHVAVVSDRKLNADGTYTLTVFESNWDQDELIDCNIHYTYFPEASKIVRQGNKKRYEVAGFIYSKRSYAQKDIPPEYSDVALPDSVTYPEKAYFRGVAEDDVGLKEVRITVSGPRGPSLPVFSRKLSGLKKDLSDLWFDSNSREYAGIDGTYLVTLFIIDTKDQVRSHIFSLQVQGVN